MSTDAYDAFDDPYVYKGTTVLRNLADIRDQATLDAFELEMSTIAATETFPNGEFDASHFRSIHHHLFKDVYEWAGNYRTVRIFKGGNPFCYPDHLGKQMDKLFGKINKGNVFIGLDTPAFINAMADFLADLNALHPFREGNGRTQLSFVSLLSDHVSQPLDLSRVNRRTYLPAIIASFGGDSSALRDEMARWVP